MPTIRPELQVYIDNPDLFILRYFPHRITKLEDFHLRLIKNSVEKTRGLILYPAAHGKTTLVSTLLPIWEICRDPNIRLSIIAKNDQEAKKIMQNILGELQGNQQLIEDFGPFKSEDRNEPKAWSLSQITIDKRTKNMKEPTIAVFGSGSNDVLGSRSDRVVCDDVITEKNSSTEGQRATIKEWFDLAVETMPEEDDDRITVVGTRFHPEDLYGDLIELQHPVTGENLWDVQYEDAIADEDNHKTLWPARWPWERLMVTKAKVGTLSFNKRYRNIAVDESRLVFKEEYVKGGYYNGETYPGCLDRNYKIGEYESGWRRAAGFDPAVGTSRSAKFCAHVTLAVGSCKHHERCFWVIDVERGQLALPNQVKMILAKHQQYGLDTSIVEANSFQAGLYQAIQQEMEQNPLRIEPHYTTRSNKPDPEIGIRAMAPWFQNGQVHIPVGDVASREKTRQLIEELVMYPGKTTDTVMAFWFAWKTLQESAPKYKSYNRLVKTGWGKRMTRKSVKNPYYVRNDDPV
jgi:hypothetical protein